MIYFVFAAVATAFAYLAVHARGRKKVIMDGRLVVRPNYSVFTVSFLVYFIPAALRYGIGQDYFYTYKPMFDHIAQESKSIYTNQLIKYSEAGFTLLNRAISIFTNDAQWLFVVCAFISLVIVYICIRDYSTNIPLSVFMLVLGSYYLGSYSLVRQSMAIAIFLYSLRYVKEKKIIKYGICMLLAVMIHSASLIYIPFYFIGTRRFTKKQYVAISLGSIVGLNLFAELISTIVALTRFSNRINVDSEYNYLLSLVVLIVFFVGVYGLNEKNGDENYRLFLNILFVSASLIGVSSFLDTSDRIIFAYYYTNFITIPHFISNGKFGRIKLIIIGGVFFSLFVLWGYEHFYYDQFAVLPYVSIFNR